MALKKTSINATLFEEGGAQQQHNQTHDVDVDSPAVTLRDRRGSNATDAEEDVTQSNAKGKNKKQSKSTTTLPTSATDSDEKIILVQFDEGDPENPKNWSSSRKWLTTILLNVMTLAIGLSTTAYSSGIDTMVAEFGVSTELGQLGLFMFNFACALAPLFFAPFCEIIGRREVYVTAFGLFTLSTFFLVFGQNIATILIGRFFQGLTGCIGTILVGGTFSDIYVSEELSVPTSLFTFSAIVSTVGAPLYAGYIDQYAGWRWIQRTMICFTGLVFILEALLFKETRGSAILTRRAKKLRKETGDSRFRSAGELERDGLGQLFRESSVRSIHLLVTEPVILAYGSLIALAWGIVFLFLSAIPIIFGDLHGWSTGNVGLSYLPLILGCFLGFATGLIQDAVYRRKVRENNGVARPEFRLYGALVFAPFMSLGLFVIAWTGYRADISYWGPLVGLLMVILGIYHIFLSVYAYTADAYGEQASSAISGQGLLRNTLGAVTPLFATQMINGMGVQWAGTLLALLALMLVPVPFILYIKGDTIRAKSKNAVKIGIPDHLVKDPEAAKSSSSSATEKTGGQEQVDGEGVSRSPTIV